MRQAQPQPGITGVCWLCFISIFGALDGKVMMWWQSGMERSIIHAQVVPSAYWLEREIKRIWKPREKQFREALPRLKAIPWQPRPLRPRLALLQDVRTDMNLYNLIYASAIKSYSRTVHGYSRIMSANWFKIKQTPSNNYIILDIH